MMVNMPALLFRRVSGAFYHCTPTQAKTWRLLKSDIPVWPIKSYPAKKAKRSSNFSESCGSVVNSSVIEQRGGCTRFTYLNKLILSSLSCSLKRICFSPWTYAVVPLKSDPVFWAILYFKIIALSWVVLSSVYDNCNNNNTIFSASFP